MGVVYRCVRVCDVVNELALSKVNRRGIGSVGHPAHREV